MNLKSSNAISVFVFASLLSGCSAFKDPNFWAAMNHSPNRYQTRPATGDTPGQAWQLAHSQNSYQASVTPAGFRVLEGCSLVAADGHYLGKITRNKLDPQSIANSVGKYGSELSPDSIMNQVGKYGGRVSPDSPFNEATASPPKIIAPDGRLIGFLTVNAVLPNAINTFRVIAWCNSK